MGFLQPRHAGQAARYVRHDVTVPFVPGGTEACRRRPTRKSLPCSSDRRRAPPLPPVRREVAGACVGQTHEPSTASPRPSIVRRLVPARRQSPDYPARRESNRWRPDPGRAVQAERPNHVQSLDFLTGLPDSGPRAVGVQGLAMEALMT